MPNSIHRAPPGSPATEESIKEQARVTAIAADALPAAGAAGVRRANKAPQDTEAGCRERAAADFAQAAGMDTANGRLRLEHSGASWASRADLIHRLDASFDARRASATALGDHEDAIDRAETDRAGALPHAGAVPAATRRLEKGA